MTTTRRPVRPPTRIHFTSEAIVAFLRMQEVEQQCTCKPIDYDGPVRERQCDACLEWWRLHSILHGELRLRPWQWPAIEDPESPNPFPAGSPAAASWSRDETACQRYLELDDAAKAFRSRCPQCGRNFAPKRSWQVFCCDKCRYTHHNAELRRMRVILDLPRRDPVEPAE
jgi:hypothetical protein